MRYLPLLLLLLPSLAMAQSSAISGRVEPGPPGLLAGYPANGIVIGPITNVNINGKLNVITFGAKADLIFTNDGAGHAQDGACTGTTFTSASGGFTSSRVGQAVIIDAAGAGGITYTGTVAGFNSATSLAVSPACPTAVTGQAWRLGTDNTAAFNSAIQAVPVPPGASRGTVYVPQGNYLTLSQVTISRGFCNVTIEGDPSGTLIMPYFSGTSTAVTANAFAFVDLTAAPPFECYGGMRNITFYDTGNSPSYLNLVRVENEQGLTFENMRAWIFAGPDDSFFYIDPGTNGNFNTCGSNCTFTEQTLMRNINNWFTTNMITFAGNGWPTFSVNNNTLELGQCNPANGGSCIRLYNWKGASGALLNSHFDFNDDLNCSSCAMIKNDDRADDWNGYWTINARSQSLQSGTALFDAPANTGAWLITGSVTNASAVGMVQERNGNPVVFTPIHKGLQYVNDAPVTVSACGTSPSLGAGSSANAGEIIAGAGATACTLSFYPQIGQNNIHCSATADGQPTQSFTEGSKSVNAVTLQCRDIVSNGNCMSGAFFSYSCVGF